MIFMRKDYNVLHRLKFKTCTVFEVCWMFVGFNNIFMGSVFLGSPCICVICIINNMHIKLGPC